MNLLLALSWLVSFPPIALSEGLHPPPRGERAEFTFMNQAEPEQHSILYLPSIKSDDEPIKALAGQTRLETLYVSSDVLERNITNRGIEAIAKHPTLTLLSLRCTKMGDEGLRALTNLTKLRSLTLSFVDEVTDAGWKALGEFKELRDLKLNSTKMSDEGMKSVGGLKQLRSLDLWMSSNIGPEGFQALAKLDKLETLILRGTKKAFGDDELKSIAGLKRLKKLDLSWTRVSDAGLKELAGLENLEDLQLSFTLTTDEGLKSLITLKKLKFLGVSGNAKITEAGVAELRRSIPGLRTGFVGRGPK